MRHAFRFLLALTVMVLSVTATRALAQNPDCNCRYPYWFEAGCEGDPEYCPLSSMAEGCIGEGSCNACLIGYAQCCNTVYTLTYHGNCNGQGTKLLEKYSKEVLAVLYIPGCKGGYQPLSSEFYLAKVAEEVRQVGR